MKISIIQVQNIDKNYFLYSFLKLLSYIFELYFSSDILIYMTFFILFWNWGLSLTQSEKLIHEIWSEAGFSFTIINHAILLFNAGLPTHPLTIRTKHMEPDLGGSITTPIIEGDPTNLINIYFKAILEFELIPNWILKTSSQDLFRIKKQKLFQIFVLVGFYSLFSEFIRTV